MRLASFRVRTLMVIVGVLDAAHLGRDDGVAVLRLLQAGEVLRTSRKRGWRDPASSRRFDPDFASECAEYNKRLAEKYRRAIWSPWTPVAPDPHAPGYDAFVEWERQAKQAASERAAPGFCRPPVRRQFASRPAADRCRLRPASR